MELSSSNGNTIKDVCVYKVFTDISVLCVGSTNNKRLDVLKSNRPDLRNRLVPEILKENTIHKASNTIVYGGTIVYVGNMRNALFVPMVLTLCSLISTKVHCNTK